MKYLMCCLLFVSFALSCACAEKKEPAKVVPSPEEAVTQPQAVPVVPGAAKTSPQYKKLMDDMAMSLFGFSWVRDDINPNRMDAQELYIPSSLRPVFDVSSNLEKAIASVRGGVEDERRSAVKDALDAQKEIHLEFDLGTLSPPYRAAAGYLIEAAGYMHELYKLQLDKNIATTQADVLARGDPLSVRLYSRNAGAFCGRYGDGERCSVTEDYYRPEFGSIMWPDEMNEKMFEDIKNKSPDPANDPLLSPFTVVKPGTDGTLQGIPYAQFEPFKFYLEKIASLFEQAADVAGIDASFSEQLKKQAIAMRSDQIKPFFESDEAWGRAKGELEVVAGPYETYEDKLGTKAFYEFMLGAQDKQATEVVEKFMPLLPQIEKAYAALLGAEVYRARGIETVPTIKVVNVIVGSGEMKKAGGPSIALSLPNIGPMVDQGRAKRVIFANHHEAKYQILKALADIAVAPEQIAEVDPQSFVFDSTFHEIMHGIGPQRETAAGGTTVALAIGEYYDGLEEAKANVGGVWAAKILADNGVITPEQLKNIRTTYIAGLLRIMRFGANEAHAKGAAFEFGYLFSKGAIEARGERFFVNHDKLQAALDSIVAEIGRALAAGDAKAAKELLETYPAKSPALLDDLAKKFAAAPGPDGSGIPRDVALVYHVKGM